jgi:hypothetical protein
MIGRLVALVILVVVAWVAYSYARPDGERPVLLEKGVYQGQPVTPLDPEAEQALRQRALGATDQPGRLR